MKSKIINKVNYNYYMIISTLQSKEKNFHISRNDGNLTIKCFSY